MGVIELDIKDYRENLIKKIVRKEVDAFDLIEELVRKEKLIRKIKDGNYENLQ